MATITHAPPDTDAKLPCPLCTGVSGRVVWHCAAWRVVHADSLAETDFPAFYRLVSNAHHEEWTDLPEPLRQEGLTILACIETVLRECLRPKKINLASLGNEVPHVHWHIIARFDWDSHFPSPVWGASRRTADPQKIAALRAWLPDLEAALIQALQPWKDVD